MSPAVRLPLVVAKKRALMVDVHTFSRALRARTIRAWSPSRAWVGTCPRGPCAILSPWWFGVASKIAPTLGGTGARGRRLMVFVLRSSSGCPHRSGVPRFLGQAAGHARAVWNVCLIPRALRSNLRAARRALRGRALLAAPRIPRRSAMRCVRFATLVVLPVAISPAPPS